MEHPSDEGKAWWKSRRRPALIAAVIVVAVLVATVHSFHRNLVKRAYLKDSDAKDSGTYRIFSELGLHRLTEFPWYVTTINFGSNDKSGNALEDVQFKGTKKLPQALVIGAKKAGTRALLEFIRVHPSVRAAGHEVHYFDKNYSKGLEWYRNMMPTTIDGQITIEKTPSYLVTYDAPNRVREMDPNIKIIIVVKDPVERAISDYTQSITKHKRKKSFEEYVFQDMDTLEVNETRLSINTGVYCKHLENWLEAFPMEQFCFIDGQNLVGNPAAELRKLQDFLELKQVITEEHFYFNSTKGFPCLKKREASGTPHCLGKGKGRTHPDVPIRAKAALYDYFRPYNERLYELTGINFDWEKSSPLEKLMGK